MGADNLSLWIAATTAAAARLLLPLSYSLRIILLH
jgi:hypothetical protein